MSPLRGEKPIFGLMSKNNTGIAALRAGLPVTKKTSHFFLYSRCATQDHYRSLLGMVIEEVRPILHPRKKIRGL